MKHKKRKAELFEKIVREMEHDIYKICLYYTRDELPAQEITQQILFNIYVQFDKLDLERLRGYAFRSARNRSYNWHRKFKRLSDGQIEDVADECAKLVSVEDTCIREEEMRLARELSESLLTSLHAKNPDWYELVIMAYYFEMPQAQIAEHLGVDRYAVSSKLYRAKKWIRENFQEDYEKYLRDIAGL